MRIAIVALAACAAAPAGLAPPADPVRVVSLVPQPALIQTVEATAPELSTALAGTIASLVVRAKLSGIEVVGPPFSRYRSRGERFVVDVGVPIRRAPSEAPADVRVGELPGGVAATVVHVGPHARLGETYAALDRWIATHHRREAGPRWEVYLTDPANPDPQRTAVFAPLDGEP